MSITTVTIGAALRPFPWPWRAALAISNDIDDASPELFSAIHTLLSSREETPYGRGLGLEVSDSLWVWANDPELLGILDGHDRLTPQAEALAALATAGWIDALHAIGDFNTVSGFNRSRAAFAYKTLEQLGIRLKIWINHGNRNNLQNFRCRLVPGFSGDSPVHDEYHADLAAAYGIRSYWWHEVVNHPLSCTAPSTAQVWRLRAEAGLKNTARLLLGRSGQARPADMLLHLAMPVALRDDTMLWGFSRYNQHPQGVWGRPGRHTFKYQLTPGFLRRLERCQGYAILYTHFGQPRQKGVSLPQPLIDDENMTALERLAAAERDGRILVATTQRLLDWWVLNQHLEWHEERGEDGSARIVIDGIADPVLGFRKPAATELSGLAFTCSTPERTIVSLDGNRLDEFIPFASADGRETGLHLPWRPLPLPPQGFLL